MGQVYGGGGFAGLGEDIHVMPDRRFIAENLKPGKYMLGGFLLGDQRSMLGKEALNYTLDIKAGEAQYFGLYKYVVVSSANMIRPGTFNLVNASNARNQASLLPWVEEATRGTKWHAKMRGKI